MAGHVPEEPEGASYPFPSMAVNPDPKPGRWILPLVILGMVAFTYFFVRSLPEASPDTTLASGPGTTAPDDGGTTTTTPGDGGTAPTVSDEVQAYVAELDAINGELGVLDTEIVAVSTGFDADPRQIEFDEAETRFEAVAGSAQALADRVAALTPPAGFENNQANLVQRINLAAGAASEALAGLRSSDTGELRRAAVAAFTSAAADFSVEVETIRAAAGLAPDA